jgi:hypothetical protein
MAEGFSMTSLSLYIITFNCALTLIDTAAVASQLFIGLDDTELPDLLVISLQEIAPLAQSFIGGSFLVPYFARFEDAVNIATKERDGDSTDRYTPIVARNVGMTAIMVFAKDPAAIEGIETAGVGVGASEMGNKGAVGVRLLYRNVNSSSDSSAELTFVSAHLAAMEEELERRNEDWKNIVRGLVFSSTSRERQSNATSLSAAGVEDEQPLLSVSPRSAGIYKPTSHLFVAGDLNYRTSNLKPSPLDHRDSFPQPHHDEAHPQHHFNLFENDQLTQEREAGRTLHGMIEAPVTFPPTYKYNSDEPFLVPDDEISHWSWAKHRWPSWCDRILYLDVPPWLKRKAPEAEIIPHEYVALPLFPTSDHRAVALAFTVPLIPIPKPDEEDEESDDPRIKPPFTVNPNWRADREKARRLELISGFTMYLTGTWEGWSVLIGTAAGVVGGFFLLKAALDF